MYLPRKAEHSNAHSLALLCVAKKEVVRGRVYDRARICQDCRHRCCRPADWDDLLSEAFPGEAELCFILPQGMWVSPLDGKSEHFIHSDQHPFSNSNGMHNLPLL